MGLILDPEVKQANDKNIKIVEIRFGKLRWGVFEEEEKSETNSDGYSFDEAVGIMDDFKCIYGF